MSWFEPHRGLVPWSVVKKKNVKHDAQRQGSGLIKWHSERQRIAKVVTAIAIEQKSKDCIRWRSGLFVTPSLLLRAAVMIIL